MNISIASLRLQMIHGPNLLTKSNLNSIDIHKSSFNYFTSSLFRFFDIKNIKISSTNFKNGLSTAIYIDSQQISIKRIFEQQVYTSKTPLISDCLFDKIDTHDVNGSAVYSTVGLDISYCTFNTIHSKNGAIMNFGTLRVQYTTFARDNAENAADIESTCITTQNILISNSIFHESHVEKLFASMHLITYGDIIISTINASDLMSMNCVGFCQINHGNFYMDHANIISTAAVYNGAAALDDCPNIHIDSTNFIKNLHRSNNKATGSALLITNPAGDGYIEGCSFIRNSPEQGHVIYMEHKMLIIENCCFNKDPEGREYNLQVRTIGVRFRHECQSLTFKQNEAIGYINTEGRKPGHDKKQSMSKSMQFSILASILAVFIKYFWSNYVLRYMCKSTKQTQ